MARASKALAVFVAVLIATTPGILVDPARFWRDVFFEINHYSSEGHGVYTVPAGINHLSRIVEFLAFRLLSEITLVSIFVFSLFISGTILAAQRNPPSAAIIFIPPILYLLYLSTNKVMVVRNILVVLPFLILGAMIAFDALLQRIHVARRPGAVVLSLIVVGTGFYTVVDRARSIRAPQDFRAEVLEAFNSIDDAIVSEEVRNFLIDEGLARESEFSDVGPEVSAPALYLNWEFDYDSSDYFESGTWSRVGMANQIGQYVVVAGPDDVDLDYYPSWIGAERIVLATPEAANVMVRQFSPRFYLLDRGNS